MSSDFAITINGMTAQVCTGTTVAVALLQVGAISRRSESAEPRQPMCGMGICYECRAEVDDRLHQRT